MATTLYLNGDGTPPWKTFFPAIRGTWPNSWNGVGLTYNIDTIVPTGPQVDDHQGTLTSSTTTIRAAGMVAQSRPLLGQSAVAAGNWTIGWASSCAGGSTKTVMSAYVTIFLVNANGTAKTTIVGPTPVIVGAVGPTGTLTEITHFSAVIAGATFTPAYGDMIQVEFGFDIHQASGSAVNTVSIDTYYGGTTAITTDSAATSSAKSFVTCPTTLLLVDTEVRSVFTTAALRRGGSRTVPTTAVLGTSVATSTRTVATAAAITATWRHAVPMTASLKTTSRVGRAVPSVAALNWITGPGTLLTRTGAQPAWGLPWRLITDNRPLLRLTGTPLLPAWSDVDTVLASDSYVLGLNGVPLLPAWMKLTSRPVRRVPMAASLVTSHRFGHTVPTAAVLSRTTRRTVPTTAALGGFSTRHVPMASVLSGAVPSVWVAGNDRTSPFGPDAMFALYLDGAPFSFSVPFSPTAVNRSWWLYWTGTSIWATWRSGSEWLAQRYAPGTGFSGTPIHLASELAVFGASSTPTLVGNKVWVPYTTSAAPNWHVAICSDDGSLSTIEVTIPTTDNPLVPVQGASDVIWVAIANTGLAYSFDHLGAPLGSMSIPAGTPTAGAWDGATTFYLAVTTAGGPSLGVYNWDGTPLSTITLHSGALAVNGLLVVGTKLWVSYGTPSTNGIDRYNLSDGSYVDTVISNWAPCPRSMVLLPAGKP